MKGAIIKAVIGQFGNPRGAAGSLAGWEMAHRPSNRKRNEWVVSLLDVRPADQILEIGFGPGVAIAETGRRVGPSGHVYGIDRSGVMLRQATRRNAAAIRAGRVTLMQASVEELPPAFGGPFDAIFSVNSFAFWSAPAQRLEDLRRRLAPDGRIAVAAQPRHPGMTRDTSLAASQLTELFRSVGFGQMRSEKLDLNPPVVCVIAAG